MSIHRRTGWLGLLAAVMTGTPLLGFAFRFGAAAPLSLFQADAFYYLDITRSSAGRPGFTFDGVHQTNGFHPLWQWLLSFSRWLGLINFTDPSRAALEVFFLNTILLSLAAGLLTLFAARQLRSKPLALLVTAPGLIWFAATPITPGYLSTWSYANGMESALSLSMMTFALLLWRDGDASTTRDLCFSFALGLAVLARLDDVFFLAAIVAWGLLFRRLSPRRLIFLVAPAASLILAYLLYNRLHVGAFLPLSGVAKAGLAIDGNLRWSAKLFVPMLTKTAPSVLDRGAPDAFAPEAIRAFQMIVPPLICLIELAATQRSRRGFGLLQALCVGVVLKGLYNFVLVAGHSQGLWYYTVSIAIANLVLVVWLDRLGVRLWSETPLKRYWIPGYVILGLFSFSALYGTVSTEVPAWPFRLLRRAPAFAAELKQNGDPCFTELDDGFTSYALNVPAEAGIGLALDSEAMQASRQNTLLPLLRQRGCSLLIASPVYAGAVQDYLATKAWQQGVNLFAIHAGEFQRFTLRPLSSPDNIGWAIFRIEPISP
ncbi:MAG: hypothetical protein ACRYFU_26210 [Janthinobacterium lividum]